VFDLQLTAFMDALRHASGVTQAYGLPGRKDRMTPPSPLSVQSSWRLRLAFLCTRQVIGRALLAAVLVGSLLVFLHQGDAIFAGQMTGRVVLKMLLTPLIPFCVTLLGALLNSNPAAGVEALRLGWKSIRRSLMIAAIVGGTIIALNQGDILLAGAVTPRVFVKMVLTPCVPFCVSLYGAYVMYRSVAATRQE
jgi:hypothetical protein